MNFSQINKFVSNEINESIIQIKKSGQLTIPAKLREYFFGLDQDGLIKAKPTKNGLLLQPLKTNAGKKLINQKKSAKEILQEFAQIAKSAKNPNVNLTEFVIKDRESH